MGIGLFRLILALTVVITHTHPIWGFTMGNPVIAVRAFFLISGFYMTMILTEKYSDNVSFLKNRFLKIFPIYWTVLVLTVISCIGAFILRKNWGEMYYLINNLPNLELKDKLLIIISHFTIFGRGVVEFGNYQGLSGIVFLLIPQAWTLVLELWFYFLIPFVFKNKFIISLLLVGSILIKYSVAISHPGDVLWSYRYFPAELCYFLLGWYSYRIYLKFKNKNNRFGLFWTFFAIVLLSTFNYINFDINLREWIFYLCLMILIPLIFKYSQNSLIDRKLGELSYPVYITHILVNNIINPLLFVPFALNRNWQAPVMMVGSIVLSILINQFIQNPIEKIREAGVK